MRWLVLGLLLGCGRPTPATLADGCFNLATTLCDREQQCETLTGSVGQCRTDAVTACCAGADCSTPIIACASGNTCCVDEKCTRVGVDSAHATSVFDGCESAIHNLSCGQLAAGVKPEACAPSAAK